MRRLVASVTALTMAVAACGGDDSADPTTAAPTADPTVDETSADDQVGTTAAASQPTDDGADDTSADDTSADDTSGEASGTTGTAPAGDGAPPATGVGDNSALVTIDGQAYQFDVTPGPIQRCDPDFFGAFWAIATQQDGGLEVLLPPEGDANSEDPPSIKVRDDATGAEWIADPSTNLPGVEAGQSQVDSFTVDGRYASGTATFIEQNAAYATQSGGAPLEPSTGTFEILCAAS